MNHFTGRFFLPGNIMALFINAVEQIRVMAKSAKGLQGWVESFRAGKHSGKGELAKHTFTKDDLDQMVLNLKAANPVPHTITHEKMYSPFAFAHGVEAKREGDTLFLRSDNINPDFEKLVKSGALYERSVGIVKDAVKGFMLDHIAWLGAEPPAVEGLAPVNYAKEDAFTAFASQCAVDDKGEFSFVDTQTPRSLKKIARSIQLFLVDKFDLATANTVIPEHYIDDVEWAEQRAREAQENEYKKKQKSSSNSIYSKQTGSNSMNKFTQEDIDAAVAKATKATQDTEQAKFNKERDEQNATFAKDKQERLQGDWQAVADKAIEEGRLTPAQAEGLAEFASNLPVDGVVTFSRVGENKKAKDVEEPMNDWLTNHIASLPKQVAMARDANGDYLDAGQELDNTDSSAIAEQAVIYQKAQADKGLTISVSDAVAHVTKPV